MRVRVVVEKEATAGTPAPPNPVALGILLAPVGGLVGTVAAGVLFSLLHGVGTHFMSALEAGGVVLGSIIALPVTALLFPMMFHARAERGAYLTAGPLCGMVASLLLGAPVLIVSGGVAGFVTALIFMGTMRRQSVVPAAKQDTD